MRIDLHTHSSVSDGTDDPRTLVRTAAEAGLDVVALTDHDTAEGWSEATEAAVEVGITLVRGMEISTRLGGAGVHLLAYLPDPTYAPLAAALDKILDGRNSRVPAILRQAPASSASRSPQATYAAAPPPRPPPADRTWPT